MPEEQDNVRRIWKTEIPRFFEEGMLKQSWKYRLKDEHRSEEWYELTPVSYTHLDVYKRQLYGRKKYKSVKEAKEYAEEILHFTGLYERKDWLCLLYTSMASFLSVRCSS